MESALCKAAPDGLEVIETFGYSVANGFIRLGLHLDRCTSTCEKLNFPFDRAVAIQALGEAVANEPAQAFVAVRMTVDALGLVAITTREVPVKTGPWRIAVASERISSDDPWLGVKTSHRAVYDRARTQLPDGVDEMIFLNERDEVCEGTITNIFVHKGSDLLTPPLASGVLPGIYRDMLVNGDTSPAREAVLHLPDLAGDFFVANSLRGKIEAKLV